MSSKTSLIKARYVVLDQVPDVLGGPYYSFERMRVLSENGKIAVKYKNTGSVLLGNINEKDTKLVKSNSPIIIWESFYPLMLSIHEDGTLQIVNVETGSTEKYTFDTKEATLKKAQCVLASEDSIYCITPNRVIVWDRMKMAAAPRTIPLEDKRRKEVRVIINVKQNFSHVVSPNRLLFGNGDVFQIWEMDKAKEEMFMIFEGRNANSQSKYLGIFFNMPNVLTLARDGHLLWDVQKAAEKPFNPKELSDNDPKTMITSVDIDDTFIVLGYNTGLVSLRQKRDGEKIHDLNIPVELAVKADSLLDYNFDNKVNCIKKIGRWVFCGFENSRMAVYDFTKARGEPVLEFQPPNKMGSVKSLLVEKNSVILTVQKGDKEKEKKETKPDIAICNPKLRGIDFYFENVKRQVAGANQMTLLLLYSHTQISGYLQSIEAQGEDVSEFSATIEKVQLIISAIIRDSVDLPFKLLLSLLSALDEYEDLLEKLSQTGKLMRFFSSSRLRRNLEFQNSAVHNQINEVEQLIRSELTKKNPAAAALKQTPDQKNARKGTTSLGPLLAAMPQQSPGGAPATFTGTGEPMAPSQGAKESIYGNAAAYVQRENMIKDGGGRRFWQEGFGEILMVAFPKFIQMLKLKVEPFAQIEERQLQSILDPSDTGYVSQYKFSEFLRGFGPVENCISNMKKILNEKWFHGFLTSREAQLLLQTGREADGTFLIRFSKSKAGSFALAFLKDGDVRHILIESNMPHGLIITEQTREKTSKTFNSLHDIIEHYSYVLKYPYSSSLPTRVWFHGDLSSEEANDMLAGQRAGTFLIRFSASGNFAASFVDSRGDTRHVLVETVDRGNFRVNSGDGQTVSFPDIQDLVAHYREKGVFKFPLKTTNAHISLWSPQTTPEFQ